MNQQRSVGASASDRDSRCHRFLERYTTTGSCRTVVLLLCAPSLAACAAANLVGRISRLSDGANNWAISATSNGADSIRAQWYTTSAAGPWTDISAYASDFTIATGVAPSGSVTVWLRIQTPTATTSFQPHSSTLTVTAQ